MTQAQTCPCGSQKALADCCLPLIQGKSQAPTPEALLRARYTAFARGDVDFILNTHHSRTRGEAKREEIEQWSKSSEWLGLEILQSSPVTPAKEGRGDYATVVFHARYQSEGKVNDHYEHSEFEKENGQWRFLDAQGLKPGPYRRETPKVGRNDVCPCGSGKKYKKCCGAQSA